VTITLTREEIIKIVCADLLSSHLLVSHALEKVVSADLMEIYSDGSGQGPVQGNIVFRAEFQS
jgi:hypothetical protein